MSGEKWQKLGFTELFVNVLEQKGPGHVIVELANEPNQRWSVRLQPRSKNMLLLTRLEK